MAPAIRAVLLCLLARAMGQGCGGPECVVGVWDDAPANVPASSSQNVVDGPFSGNGDLGLVVGMLDKQDARARLAIYLDLMQWHTPTGSSGVHTCGYGIGDAPAKTGLGVLSVEALGFNSTSVHLEQHIANATVHTWQTSREGTIRTESFAAATENLAVTRVWWEPAGAGGGTPPAVAISTAVHTGLCGACRTNGAGLASDRAWQWASSDLGREFRSNSEALPARLVNRSMHSLTMHRESATLGTTVLPAALAEGLVENATTDGDHASTTTVRLPYDGSALVVACVEIKSSNR